MTNDQWLSIKKKGVLSNITISEIYEQKIAEGLMRVLLQDGQSFIPSAESIKAIHSTIFSGVTPWAGQFTKNPLITNGYITCDPRLLDSELSKLETAWEAYEPDTKSPPVLPIENLALGLAEARKEIYKY